MCPTGPRCPSRRGAIERADAMRPRARETIRLRQARPALASLLSIVVLGSTAVWKLGSAGAECHDSSSTRYSGVQALREDERRARATLLDHASRESVQGVSFCITAFGGMTNAEAEQMPGFKGGGSARPARLPVFYAALTGRFQCLDCSIAPGMAALGRHSFRQYVIIDAATGKIISRAYRRD